MQSPKRLALVVAALLPLAVLGDAAGGATLRVTPSVLDSDDAIRLSVPGSDRRPAVTLRPVAGGRALRVPMRRTSAAGEFTGTVRAPSGEYEVLVRSGRSEPVAAGRLTVREPRIEWLSAVGSGASGDSYRALGRNFGRRRGDVLVGGVAARVTRWRDDEIRFRAPRPAAGVHDVTVRAGTAQGVAPCAIAVCGAKSPPPVEEPSAGPEPDPRPVWRLDWKPGQRGESSSHWTQQWHGSLVVYDPQAETLLFETRADAALPVGGMYVMLSGGGWAPEVPDMTAEIFFDLTGSEPRVSVFAYQSRVVGDYDGDGWSDDAARPADLIASSVTDPGFLLASLDRTEGGTRTCGFLIDVRDVNRHTPRYGRTDGSAWTGLRFGGDASPNAGVWSYLYADPDPVYDAMGRLTSWTFPRWGTYPAVDGPDFTAVQVPLGSIESALLGGGVPAPTGPRETVAVDGSSLIVQRGSTDADVLAGGAGADAIRAGAGGDRVYGGDGDDVVLVDAASGGAVVDAGAGSGDLLEIRPDPLGPAGAADPRWNWGLTLVVDPVPGGAPRDVVTGPDGVLLLGPDASGRVILSGGARVEFRGVEQIRF